MSRKRIKAVIVVVLLALAVSINLSSPATPSVVLATECDVTASGCH
jgi:hypothetical protein